QISLAPNTSWPLTVSRKNKQLPPGKYRLAVHVKTSGLTQSWNQLVTVRIARQDQQVRRLSLWLVGIGVISIGAIAAISYWVISKSQPNG
ncbi:MAG: WxL protein host-binding domain-containing protein, partial [Weissella cibaria]